MGPFRKSKALALTAIPRIFEIIADTFALKTESDQKDTQRTIM